MPIFPKPPERLTNGSKADLNMPTLVFIFTNLPALDLPNGWLGWLGWVALLGVIFFLLRRWRTYNQPWNRKRMGLLLSLVFLMFLTTLLMPGIRLGTGELLPPSLVPRDIYAPTVMPFAALSWILAAGLLGPTPAAFLAAAAGFFLAFWDVHSAFLPLEMAFLAACTGAAMQQRYRTRFYRLARHPLFIAVLLALTYPALFVIDSLYLARGVLANRLDYAFTFVNASALSMGISFLVSALFAEIIAVILSKQWGSKSDLRPSPAESRLATRFLYGLTPLALALVFALMLGNWVVAGRVARAMLEERVSNAAQMTAQAAPSLLVAGQNLISELSTDPRLYTAPPEEIREVLSTHLRLVPFFTQFILLDVQAEVVAGYPMDSNELSLSPVENAGVRAAINGVAIQYYSVPPAQTSPAASLSFVSEIRDESQVLRGILIGRSDLNFNPQAQPMITSLKSVEKIGGTGILLDDEMQILYHPNPALVMTVYPGQVRETDHLYDDIAEDGTRQLVYVQPVVGRPWKVILTVPAGYVQQQALNIAAPLLVIIVILFVVAVGMIRLGLRAVTASLHTLSIEADRMARGQLEQPLRLSGEDEVGQLGRAFEQMRAGLKARLDELNRLLLVSQGVASTLEIEQAMQPVLEAALIGGATAARIVLAPAVVPELGGGVQSPSSFGIGPQAEAYRNLDEQILSLTFKQDRLLLSYVARTHLLVVAAGYARPQALLALALHHENVFYGAIWVAYDEIHQFSEEEVRYMTTLAGQAVLAAANSRLFLTTEIGRQRLQAILASTPDPVLVTDPQNRLILANPAAEQAFGWDTEAGKGQPIERVVTQKDLLEVLRSSADDRQSAEVKMADGRVYLAIASSVMSEGRRVGRVGVLRDITHFKELDTLKSEFVSTVSHDLRSPLTLIRGYATMLQMVGELNEQQNNHVRKIITGVENMSRLVNSLLDLGRIEAGVGLQLETVPLQDVVERVVGALQLQAAQKRINLTATISPQTSPWVEADYALLQQALHNLVENAIKYTDTGGFVQVRVGVQREDVVFEVQDNGIGIAPADQPRLFEKFYRAGKKGDRKDVGSGLGLAIVKSIAERHGGRVWLDSFLGKGSTFYLSIPLRQKTAKT
jgi:PAS domain S-box-containing protein